jgi:carboxylesterase
MRGLAGAFAAGGFAVDLPLLPGHGTAVEDMIATSWADWSATAERAYLDLAGGCDRVVLAGLSMGGTLACWLAARHPEVAGAVLVNPACEPPADSFVAIMQGALEAGSETIPGVGGDLADPDAHELAYELVPVRAALSLWDALTDLAARLGEIRCPLLLLTSPNDHVVPPTAGDFLTERVSGPVERVLLERSYHVATLDHDRAEIESRAVAFARSVTSG